jgi:hypothetical protein
MAKNPRRIYVASSWRNNMQPEVVKALREEGHEVYDFKNPRKGDSGFHWSDIDPQWESWTPCQYRLSLDHRIANRGFRSDYDAMCWANTFVGVMPFGRSASMEMGWGAGNGKQTILLLSDGEPELMVKMFDFVCLTVEEVLFCLENGEKKG